MSALIRLRSFRILLPLAAILLQSGVGATQGRTEQRRKLECAFLPRIQGRFLEQHVLYNKPDAKLEARTTEQFIKRLDGAKLYLLQSDVAEITKMMTGHFDVIERGDCSPIKKAYELYSKRVSERVQFAKTTVKSSKFKFDPKTEILLDPESRTYPKTQAEQEAFHKKYLQFQLSNYMATGQKIDEARKSVGRAYDRLLKRVKEQTEEQLYSDYLNAFGRSQDPHSSYFSADELEDFDIQMGLKLEGIGATLSSQDGFTVVEQLIEGGAARRSGQLQPQDKILAVGQFKGSVAQPMETVIEMELREVVRRIRGSKGSKVKLLVLREKTKSKFEVTLVRDEIKLEEEAAQLSMIEREIDKKKVPVGLVTLPSFYGDGRRGGRSCANDVRNLLREAKAKGAQAIVLDLSSNSGGALDEAVRLAGLFFRQGSVVKQSGADPNRSVALDDRDATVDWNGPLVVLTSRLSASASEIVAGTLRDYQRAVIVGGDHTFGKGSVQSVQPVAMGLGAIKVTVGWFYTPGGFSTQHRGVESDIIFPSLLNTDDFGEKSLDYSLEAKRLPAFLSPEAYVTSGSDAWKRIDATLVSQLKSRADERVKQHPEFQKILADSEKIKARGKLIHLSESLKENKERKDEIDEKKSLTKDEKVKEYLKRADVQEAVNIVSDLYALESKISLDLVKVPPPIVSATTTAALAARGSKGSKPDPEDIGGAVKFNAENPENAGKGGETPPAKN